MVPESYTPPNFNYLSKQLEMSSLEAATLFGAQGMVAVITGSGLGKSSSEIEFCTNQYLCMAGLMMAKALEENGLQSLVKAAKCGWKSALPSQQ